MDPVTVSTILTKLISAGVAINHAFRTEGFDETDISALKAVTEAGGSLFALAKKGTDARPAALYMALTSVCFGAALSAHWAGSKDMVPEQSIAPQWLTKWRNKAEHDRREEITTRTRYAERDLLSPGFLEPLSFDLLTLTDLTGPTLRNPVYRALWQSFSNPKLCPPGEDGPLLLKEGDAREFEGHFRRFWIEALATPIGQQIQAWKLGLTEETGQILCRILAEDLAAWGRRHVFGNARTQPPGDPIPFMALDDMYVEPNGIVTYEGKASSATDPAPILKIVGDLLKDHRLVVVRADFGHGKSLTARRLARDLAQKWLSSVLPATEQPYPLFIKCARDVLGDYNHEMTLRRAVRANAQESLGQVESQDSKLYDLPSNELRWLLLDGLDEIAFQPNQLREMFGLLEGHTGAHCRAIVFTRPGALHSGCVPKGTPIVDLQPLSTDGIHEWVRRWNQLPNQTRLSIERLKTAGVENLARVPILLLMIALTWKDHEVAEGKLDQTRLYEHFFRHIAHGKHDGDTDEHTHIKEASARLLLRLQAMDVFRADEAHTGVDAMLWMMSRTAWEAHRLNYAPRPQDLQQRHVETLVVDELQIHPSDAILVKVGLLLAMQFNPSGDGSILLFGHQSFREFLVARYWRSQLAQIANRRRQRDAEKNLAQSRLYQPHDKAFFFLKEMLSDFSDSERSSLADWAEEFANNEMLALGEGGRFRDDHRATLREAALAIGSELKPGFRLDGNSFRSLHAWFTMQQLSPWTWIPGANCSRANLSMLSLTSANCRSTNFEQCNLMNTELHGANLENANLKNSVLFGARLNRGALKGANLEGATINHASLFAADLRNTNLRRAKMQFSVLTETVFLDAKLVEADLEEARLTAAIFEKADLTGANLNLVSVPRWARGRKPPSFEGAILQRASMEGAQLVRANLKGADLREANLSRANLLGADLSGANLSGTNLCGTNLRFSKLGGVRFQDATFNADTKWPRPFTRESAIASGARFTEDAATADIKRGKAEAGPEISGR